MKPPEDEPGSEQLADRVDQALAALHRGQLAPLEELLGSQTSAGDLSPMLAALRHGPAVPVAGLPPLAVLPGYRIVREIGRGGMGIVYEAEQESPRRRVALKVLRQALAEGYQLRLFEQEIEALARLRHPAIATIYQAGRTPEGRYFFTMELVSGAPLCTYARERALDRDARLRLFAQTCAAVQYAHDQGVVHRDLKPGNILVEAAGHPRIVDFGLARLTGADATAPATAGVSSLMLGTPGYMSPEQARGDRRAVGAPTDVYALGMILYELLADRLPFDLTGATWQEAARVACEEPATPPGRHAPGLPGELDAITLKALEKEPARRYASAAALAADVNRFLTGEPVEAHRPSRLYVLRKRLRRRRIQLGLAGAGLLLALVGLATGSWWTRRSAVRQAAQDTVQAAAALVDARRAILDALDYVEAGAPAKARERIAALPAREEQQAEMEVLLARIELAEAEQRKDDNQRRSAITRAVHWHASAPGCPAMIVLLASAYRGWLPSEEQRWRAALPAHAPHTVAEAYLCSLAAADPDEAGRYARQATAMDAAHALAWRRLLGLCRRAQDYPGALAAAREVLRLEGDPELVLVEGQLLLLMRRCAEALDCYSRGLDLSDSLAERCYRGRSVAFLCQGRYEDAVTELNQAVALSHGRAWSLYARATPLWICGRHAEAADDYRAARAIRMGTRGFEDARLFLVLHDQAEVLRRRGEEAAAAAVEGEARETLAAAMQEALPGGHLHRIFQCLAGELAPGELLAGAGGTPAERCEAAYYAAEAARLRGQPDAACAYYRACIATDVLFSPAQITADAMNEYHLALWRLSGYPDEVVSLPCSPVGPLP